MCFKKKKLGSIFGFGSQDNILGYLRGLEDFNFSKILQFSPKFSKKIF